MKKILLMALLVGYTYAASAKVNTLKSTVKSKSTKALYCKKTFYNSDGTINHVSQCILCKCSELN